MATALVARALRMALARRQPAEGLLHHSDRGGQCAGHDYRTLLAAHHIEASMSRAGNCYDNAMQESFFATLKNRACEQAVPDTSRRPHGHFRLHRGVLQSAAAPFVPGLSEPG